MGPPWCNDAWFELGASGRVPMRASAHAMTFVLIAAPLVLSTAAEAGEDGKPIQVQTNFQINTGVAGVNPTMYTVPNGYELEIKFFSCEAQMPPGQVIFPNLLTTGGGGFAGFDFIPIKQATILG